MLGFMLPLPARKASFFSCSTRKYLLLMERLHFWTGYVRSIVKATKKKKIEKKKKKKRRLGGHDKIEKRYFLKIFFGLTV